MNYPDAAKQVNPSVEAVRKVAQIFRDLSIAKPNAKVDMMEGRVYESSCGTTACHAGWYGVGKGLNEGIVEGYGCYYQNAADIMAKDLGFDGYDYLQDWAIQNPEIWGNSMGNDIFCDGQAFGSKHNDTSLTLIDFANHWDGVADRLEAVENNK